MSDVKIRVSENGPYLVYGEIRIEDAGGTVFDTGDKKVVALCCCGGSTTKPFCAGTHSRKGFEAAERAVAAERAAEDSA